MTKSNLRNELKSLNNDFKEVLKTLKADKKEHLDFKDYNIASKISEQIDMLNYCIRRISDLLKTK